MPTLPPVNPARAQGWGQQGEEGFQMQRTYMQRDFKAYGGGVEEWGEIS